MDIENKVMEKLKKFSKTMPHFDDGRIDYHKIKTTFVVHPVLIELKEKPKIKLDFEHTESKWVKKGDLGKYDAVPNMLESAKRVLK